MSALDPAWPKSWGADEKKPGHQSPANFTPESNRIERVARHYQSGSFS
jgi:hypothetical protein